MMTRPRRRFLQQTAALGAYGLASLLGRGTIGAALAQTAADYRALVCIFLYGGNDGNNLIAPLDDYASYSAIRGANSGVGIAAGDFLPIATSGGKHYGLHPALAPLQALYGQGKLAALFNVGTLVAPITRAQYLADRFVPPNLFSHSDQQSIWEGQVPGSDLQSGWGGRIADRLAPAGTLVPMVLSLTDDVVFTLGRSTVPLTISSDGNTGLSAGRDSALGQTRYNALRQAMLIDGGNLIVRQASKVMNRALDASDALAAAINANATAIDTAFNNVDSDLANQLKQVARLIAGREALGLKRQCFFCGIGGFDTHSEQLGAQNDGLSQLANAMSAFYNATVALGVGDSVTTFTLSEFGRTLRSRSNAGTDHAWGSHHLVLGGAVKGGDAYGRYPTLVCAGPDDAEEDGVWIPTTSLEQYGATLAAWLGVSSADLNYVFPNLAQFAPGNLGFMRP